MTIDQALAWLRGLDKKEYWGGREYTDVRNVLPQLISVVEAAATSIQYAMDHDEYGLGPGRVPDEFEPLQDALTALAEAIAREQETK